MLRVDLTGVESQALAALCGELMALLADPDPTDPVVQRLNPDGYTDDDAASAEFHELVADSLASERGSRLSSFRQELPPGAGRVELDEAAADRWIRVINDLRLTLGTRLGVSEESELDPADESANLYNWLTAVQETIVLGLR